MNLADSGALNIAEAVAKLRIQDSTLVTIINQIGACRLQRGEQGYAALVHSIIGQQLSEHAARAIRHRIESLFNDGEITPKQLALISDEKLRGAGLSSMKVQYLRDLSSQVQAGVVDFQKIESMDDEEVINTLCQVKGIGRWTAQMYLIFSLNRLDVFPIGDLALRTAMCLVYNFDKTDFEAKAVDIAERWRPFRTIGCWYLYKYLDFQRGN